MMDITERPDDSAEPIGGVEFLTRSHNRVRVLDMLHEAGRLDKHTITDRLDASRTTVKRNLDSLVDRGWVREVASEYVITAPGALIAEDFLGLLESIRTAERLAPVMKWTPEPTFEFDLRELADARITLSEPNDPYAPVNRCAEAMESAASYRVLLPAVARPAIEEMHDGLLRGEARGELVFGKAVARAVESNARYERLCEEMAETGRLSAYVYDGSLPYYLGVVDETVQVGVEDEDGMQRALVESDAPAVRRWATNTYEEYRDAAATFY